MSPATRSLCVLLALLSGACGSRVTPARAPVDPDAAVHRDSGQVTPDGLVRAETRDAPAPADAGLPPDLPLPPDAQVTSVYATIEIEEDESMGGFNPHHYTRELVADAVSVELWTLFSKQIQLLCSAKLTHKQRVKLLLAAETVNWSKLAASYIPAGATKCVYPGPEVWITVKLVDQQGAVIKRSTKWCSYFGGPSAAPKELTTFVATWGQVLAAVCPQP